MDCEQIEQKLNFIIEEVYKGLHNLAAVARSNGTPEQMADGCEKLAWDICKHWPTCFAAHEPYVTPGESQQA